MALNLIRSNPKDFGEEAVKLAMVHPLCRKLPKDPILQHLRKKQQPVPQVRFEDQAIQAVRKNNEAKRSLAEAVPTRNGNIDVYAELIGSDKTAICEEYTMCQYEGDNALEFFGI